MSSRIARSSRYSLFASATASVALAASTAWAAGSGVIEINQTLAIAGGVSASDTLGFPVTIDQPGSYVLTSDLVVSDANTTGVEITAANVSLDLAGFSVRGSVTCSAGTCSSSGTGIGIDAQGAYATIRNGHVSGMGADGLQLGNSASAYDVVASHNAKNGFATGLFARLRSVRAENNGSNGVLLGSSSRVEDAQAFSNGSYGIDAATNILLHRIQAAANGAGGVRATDLTLEDSTVSGNTGVGIKYSRNSVIRDTLIVGNTGFGIDAAFSQVSGEEATAVITGNVIRGNGGAGIQASHAAVIKGNVTADNSSAGIACSSATGITTACLVTENVSIRNTQGVFGGSSVAYQNNIFNGNTTNVDGYHNGTPQELNLNMCDLGPSCP